MKSPKRGANPTFLLSSSNEIKSPYYPSYKPVRNIDDLEIILETFMSAVILLGLLLPRSQPVCVCT